MPNVRTVACAECGKEFQTTSPRAKFCPDNSACRKAASRRPSKQGRQELNAPTADVVQLPDRAPAAEGGLAKQIRASLEAAGAFETVAGMSALMLARQIDKGQDSGSAVATMTKELSRLMTEARAEAAPQHRDAADDVMAAAAAKIMRLVQ
jgi:hypothetical protein